MRKIFVQDVTDVTQMSIKNFVTIFLNRYRIKHHSFSRRPVPGPGPGPGPVRYTGTAIEFSLYFTSYFSHNTIHTRYEIRVELYLSFSYFVYAPFYFNILPDSFGTENFSGRTARYRYPLW